MVFQNPDNQIVATIVEEDVAFGPEELRTRSEWNQEKSRWIIKKCSNVRL